MDYLVYKKFYEREQAEELTQLLRGTGITVELEEDKGSLDSLYGDKHFSTQFLVKIKGSDFSTADSVLSKMSEKELDSVDPSHYLYGFTNEELFDILSKPDEWSAFDFQLSKKILNERGKEINPETIELLKNQRIKELAKPEEQHRSWIAAGYLFSLLGGIPGVFIGWHLSTCRKTLPNGQQVYFYSQDDRKHGRRIWIIGSIMFVLVLGIKAVNMGL